MALLQRKEWRELEGDERTSTGPGRWRSERGYLPAGERASGGPVLRDSARGYSEAGAMKSHRQPEVPLIHMGPNGVKRCEVATPGVDRPASQSRVQKGRVPEIRNTPLLKRITS